MATNTAVGVLYFGFIVGLLSVTVTLAHEADIVKRQLRWDRTDKSIFSQKTGKKLRIVYLKPNEGNAQLQSNKDYSAFTLYQPMQPLSTTTNETEYMGVFHFVDSDEAKRKSAVCTRQTMHAGAYYHFYGSCPEDHEKLVASGYCYKGSTNRGLVFNSLTFNGYDLTYLDGQYYADDSQTVSTEEQTLFSTCFSQWQKDQYPLKDWECKLGDLVADSGQHILTGSDSSEPCCDCNGTPSMATENWRTISFVASIGLLLFKCIGY